MIFTDCKRALRVIQYKKDAGPHTVRRGADRDQAGGTQSVAPGADGQDGMRGRLNKLYHTFTEKPTQRKQTQKEKGEKIMSAKFIESSYTNKRDIARITTSNTATPLKELPAGTELTYEGYVIQEVTNEQTGEVFTSIVVKDVDGKLYATRSESFIRALKEIIEICADDEEPIVLKIERLQSRAGREFITCALA